MNREFIWELLFFFVTRFLLLFDKYYCVFYLCSESIWCVYQKLVLGFVDDESDLHGGYVAVDCNIMILWLVGNILECFFEKIAVNIIGFCGF